MYTNVYALMICWGDDPKVNVPDHDNGHFRSQRALLMEELQSWNFTVKPYDIIPGPTSYKDLNLYLIEQLTNLDLSNSHLIVYYGGHGGQDKANNAIWYRFNPEDEDDDLDNCHINWTNLQGLFFYDYGAEVLFILDCCHAGAGATLSGSANVVQALCATGFEGIAPSTDKSLTTNLTILLERIRGERKTPIFMDSVRKELADQMKKLGGDSRTPILDTYSRRSRGTISLSVLPPRDQRHETGKLLVPDSDGRGQRPAAHGRRASNPRLRSRSPQVAPGIPNYLTDVGGPQEANTFEPPKTPKPMRPPNTYNYGPINTEQIRILTLLPATNFDSDLVCRLRTVPFPGADGQWPEYKAVSWLGISGQGDSFSALRIVGGPPSEIFVTSIVGEALKHLRSKTEDLDLWVSSACVWHEDEGNEFPLTTEIFRRASSVLAWVGPQHATTGEAVGFIEELNMVASERVVNGVKDLKAKWSALVHLMSQTYFSRRRIFQELVVARDIQLCMGHHRVSWLRFCEAVSIANTIYGKAEYDLQSRKLDDLSQLDAFDIVNATSSFFRLSSAGSAPFRRLANIETLVTCLPRLRVAIPRMAIYAFLTSASDGTQARDFLTERHADELPVLRVYEFFVLYCVQASKSVDIICRPWAPSRKIAQHNGTKILTLPKWMQTIDTLTSGPWDKVLGRITTTRLVGTPTDHWYNASRGTRGYAICQDLQVTQPRGLPDLWTRSLTVGGIRLGTIMELEPSRSEVAFGAISQQALDIVGWIPGQKRVPDHLWRTLVADRAADGSQPPPWYHDACRYWIRKSREAAPRSPLHEGRGKHPGLVVEFVTRMANTTHARRYMSLVDDQGVAFYGLAPSRATEGDTVVVLQGGSVPVVMRPTPTGRYERRCWELIGECFVYGVMEGEMMMDKSYQPRLAEFELV